MSNLSRPIINTKNNSNNSNIRSSISISSNSNNNLLFGVDVEKIWIEDAEKSWRGKKQILPRRRFDHASEKLRKNVMHVNRNTTRKTDRDTLAFREIHQLKTRCTAFRHSSNTSYLWLTQSALEKYSIMWMPCEQNQFLWYCGTESSHKSHNASGEHYLFCYTAHRVSQSSPKIVHPMSNWMKKKYW